MCTGSLSAAAVASSRNVTGLLQIAPQIVALAFHVGLEAFKRSLNLEDSNGSWATVVKDVDIADIHKALDDFNRTLDHRHHKKVYISATGESSVTISGPPMITQRFFHRTKFSEKTRRLQLPIKAAFHAGHLSPIPHARIFDNVQIEPLKRPLVHTLISPTFGKCYGSSNLEAVLHEIVDEIFQQPMDWQATIKELAKLVKPAAVVTPIGPSYPTQTLLSMLPLQARAEKQPYVATTGQAACREGSGAVAIVGMSVRLPGSETLDEYWQTLCEGRDLQCRIPDDRFDDRAYRDQMGSAKHIPSVPYGVFLDRPGHFDPRFFNMSPREALSTDPQQRLMLLTTYEALENAGYSPNRTPSTNTRRIASFVGQTGDDYREKNASQAIDTHFITGGIRAFGPGRLNYHFGWEGPSYSVDTACSSSAASIQLACSALLSRECDMAVSGGVNLLASSDLFAGLSKGGFLSKKKGCRTFDQDADGYVRGEGCGIIVLKRLEDAVAERDNILAVVRGATTNHSAEAISITHPHGKTQERLFNAVLEDAGVLPYEIDLAELHGTGTQAGDATESKSVTNVLCRGRTPETPLIVSTVKPSIGHGEAVSGVSSVVKAVLMMQKNAVPPHTGIVTSINDKIPSLKDARVHLCVEKTPFFPRKNGDGKRRILVNNFDAAGGNTSLLLEDPPQLPPTSLDPRDCQIIALSAKTKSAMTNNVQKLLGWLRQNAHIRVEDLAYTTTSRRMHHSIRKALPTASTEELIVELEKLLAKDEVVPRRIGQRSSVFCFTGQGSQYVSMASALYKAHPAFREQIDDYDRICVSHGFASFRPVIEGDLTSFGCSMSVQLAIVAIELSLAFLWNSWGIKASSVVGHSLGEYAALCYANVISPSDCFYLVGKRAELMDQKCASGTHAMLAVQASRSTLDELLKNSSFSKIETACLNGPVSTVLCGPALEIELVNKFVASQGIRTKLLTTQYAFHSSQLDTILDDFEAAAHVVQFAKPTIPVASTLLGEIVTADDVFGPQYLVSQTRKAVRFQSAIEALRDCALVDSKTVWIEVGPNSACLKMIRSVLTDAEVLLPSLIRGWRDWHALSSSVAGAYNAGLDVDWSEFHRPFEQNLQVVQVPNYSFDLKKYWIRPSMNAVNTSVDSNATAENIVSGRDDEFSPTHALQHIEKQDVTSDMIQVTFTANTSEPTFNKVLCGHMVNEVALCPSSVYTEMAYAAASYVAMLSGSKLRPSIDVGDMQVTRPLIVAPGDSNQIIRVLATMQRDTNEIRLQYSSSDGSIQQDHATCIARFGDEKDWISSWSRDAPHVQSRIRQLHHASADGKAHRLLRPMVYKLFSAFVKYEENYQGLEQVHLNSDLLEATANVKFRTDSGRFIHSPYWIDSIAHLSGFILNGSEFTPPDSVFISHGWKSFKIAGPLSSEKRYHSYVQMHRSKRRGMFVGDVYLLDGETVVAVCQDLRFQQIKRAVLNHILPRAVFTQTSTNTQVQHFWPQTVSFGPISGTPLSATHKHAPPVGKRLGSDFSMIVDVIVRELGINMSELDEEIGLVDLGVDSLMTSVVLATLADQHGVHLPASLFVECRSIAELRARFGANSNSLAVSTSSRSTGLLPLEDDQISAKSRASSSNSDYIQILEIIAREVGVEVSELDEDVRLVDLGVDSLLTITLLASLSELAGEELPASLFTRCQCVGDLCLYVQARLDSQQLLIDESDNSDTRSESCDTFAGNTTPTTALSECGGDDCKAETLSTAEVIREIISEETGVAPEDIQHDTVLTDVGVDSLLSTSILVRFRDQAGLALASTFFIDNPTLSAVCHALEDTLQQTADVLSDQCSVVSASDHSHTGAGPAQWSASSILLQGSSSSCMQSCLFLIPDGSGNPCSYMDMPILNHTGPVYGLRSPFLAQPSSFDMSLQDLVATYVAEVRRIQPVGPYHIGGWSFGGICAFEAAAQLILVYGQEVASLVLIDAPCPTVLPPLPIEDVEFLQSVGALDSLTPGSKVLDGGSPRAPAASGLRDRLREHFAGSINALGRYSAQAIDPTRVPKSVVIVWAQHGVWQSLGEEVKALKSGSGPRQHPTTGWLMKERTSYATCGWEELLPGSSFTCHTVEGDHFSMMRGPGARDMGAKLSWSLAPTRRH